jgi:hypothetical protein
MRARIDDSTGPHTRIPPPDRPSARRSPEWRMAGYKISPKDRAKCGFKCACIGDESGSHRMREISMVYVSLKTRHVKCAWEQGELC